MSRPPVPQAPAPAGSHLGLYALLVVAAVALLFRPALEGGFLDWDDKVNFLDHAAWRGLGREQLAWMFTESYNGPYQPLAWLTLGLDYSLWGLDAPAFHAVNVAWHACTGVCVLFLARELLARVLPAASRAHVELGALAAALFFALHPLRVESVAWITERRDVVSGPFYALCLLFWLRHAARADARWGRDASLALACFLLALLGKGIGFTLPLALFVLDVWPLRRVSAARGFAGLGRVIGEKLPFLALGLLFAWLAWRGQAALPKAMASLEQFPLGPRLMQAWYGAAFYAWSTCLPLGLSPFHPQPDVVRALDARYVLSALGLLLGLTLAWMGRASALLAAFAVYAILVLPVLGLVQTGPQLVAERYSYLSCLPFALLAGGLLVQGLESRPAWRVPLLAGALAALGALAFCASRLVPVWRDDHALWQRVRAVYPDSLTVVRKTAVLEGKRIQEIADAGLRARELRRALEVVHEDTRRLDARSTTDEPLRDTALMTTEAEYWRALGEVEPEQAAAHFERAHQLLSEVLVLRQERGFLLEEALSNLGILACTLGRWPEAVERFREWARIAPQDANAHLCLGQALVQAGQHDEALLALQRVLQLAPASREAWVELGIVHEHRGRPAEARAAYESALRIHITNQLPDDTVLLDARAGLERLAQPIPPPPPR